MKTTLWVPGATGTTDGVALAHYELHAWCLLILAWVFVPFFIRSSMAGDPDSTPMAYP